MSFTFAPAVRDRVGLLIGIAGASGSGKTLSAFKIGRGLAGGDDSKIAVVDSEGGRAKHYAPAPGEQPGENTFGFAHGDLHPPFQPEAYLAAITAADQAGFEVIIVDSFSHSWDGVGGLQDMHDEFAAATVEKKRLQAEQNGWRFDEAVEFDKASIGAWKEPKMRNKRLVARLLQCRAHLIICMRADEKMRMETVEEQKANGRGSYKKTVIIPAKDLPVEERWVPIVEKRFPYELTTSLLLTPLNPGVPIPIKLQSQHRSAVPLDRQLSEETGRALAAWARGEPAAAAEPRRQAPAPTKAAPPAARSTDLLKPPEGSRLSAGGWQFLCRDARKAAAAGAVALRQFRNNLSPEHDKALDAIGTELDELAHRTSGSDGFPGDEAIARLKSEAA
ncbi:AAA family ATPase [Methylobacterium gnaphalii]|uniref:AAA+ ATPase domain-containing protein n=1 Tax=Methylobacterium gnaphalii TaxID=1010610 RepID=A0A512JIX0_9HYPH|nr:AAA family ATPase [Methylobacterium gnaphalii]GEP09873.1 hypothetical protein MGN01_17180 [Methylobacterium gnaphalii]GJD67211.1 hypothetical protein MMMDOFMJ_0125 [Methylobacterium gnaphalii]GLS49902.1 hypothetical protein GCM10007885_27540 [Methylobacterium gnaphalii]